MREPKRFVYIPKSVATAHTYYVGVTSCMSARLDTHNAGLSPHTSRLRSWRTLVVVEFDEEQPARQFERYLETGSGREFALPRGTIQAHWRTSGSPARRGAGVRRLGDKLRPSF